MSEEPSPYRVSYPERPHKTVENEPFDLSKVPPAPPVASAKDLPPGAVRVDTAATYSLYDWRGKFAGRVSGQQLVDFAYMQEQYEFQREISQPPDPDVESAKAEARERIYLALLKRYEGDPAYDADFILAAAIKAAAWIVDGTAPVVEEARQMPFEINRFSTQLANKES